MVPTLAALAAVLAVCAVGLTSNVLAKNGLTAIDSPISDWAVAHRNGTLTPLAITVSYLGGTVAMTILVVLAVIIYGRRGQWREAGLVICTGLGSWVLVDGGKHLIGRERPPTVNHVIVKTNLAYPSGHSLGSMAVIGILSVLLIPQIRRPAMRWVAGVAAVVFVAAVGLSRIYLGVHWPTDVLGGWVLGALLVTVCFAGYRDLERRQILLPSSRSPKTTPADDVPVRAQPSDTPARGTPAPRR